MVDEGDSAAVLTAGVADDVDDGGVREAVGRGPVIADTRLIRTEFLPRLGCRL